MMVRPKVCRLCVLGLLQGIVSSAVGQQAVGVLAPSPAECKAAAQVLAATPSAPEADGDWIIATACPEGGQYIADVIRTSIASMDSVLSRRIVSASAALLDGRLAVAARTVAADWGAASLPRATALTALTVQWRRGLSVPPELLFGNGPEDPVCVLGDGALGGPYVGQSVPTSLAEDIQTIAAQILANASSPLKLRRVAQCMFRIANAVEPPAFAASGVKLTYLCQTRFRVRNTNFASATLTYDVYGTQERGSVTVTRATPSEPQRDVVVMTTNVGTVRLFYNGTLIQTKGNGGKLTCP